MKGMTVKKIVLCLFLFSCMCIFSIESVAEGYMATMDIESESARGLDRLYLYSYYPEMGKTTRYAYDPTAATDTDINTPMDVDTNSYALPLENDDMPYGIIGSDGRRPVTDVTTSPFSKIVFIKTHFQGSDGKRYVGYGTGVIIGPDLVLTAAHVLFYSNGFVEQCDVFTEYNGSNDYAEKSTAEKLTIHKNFYESNDHDYDWAIIKTSTDIGYRQGWMGFDCHTNYSDFVGYRIEITGYPGEKPEEYAESSYLMYRARGVIQTCPSKYRVTSYIDTSSGQSGAPMFDVHQTVWAIHSRYNTEGYNFGTKITPELYSLLLTEKENSISEWGE